MHQVYSSTKSTSKWEISIPMGTKRESFVCNIFLGRIWACGGQTKPHRPTNSCESWKPGESRWNSESEMKEMRFMGSSAVTPAGLFALGGNVIDVDNPKSIEYYSILRQKWLYGPEPPILRGTVGSTAFVIKNDIYMVSGWEHISKRLRSEILRFKYSDE